MDYQSTRASSRCPRPVLRGRTRLEVGRTADVDGGLWATVRHVHSAGAVVKLELADDEGHLLQVDVTRQRHEEMQPQRGERLYVRPRTMRVFVQP